MPLAVTSVGQDATPGELDELARSFDDNARAEHLLARRLRGLRDGRAKGRRWDELLAREKAPGTLELTSRVLTRLSRLSVAVRQTLARGLRFQGASITAIAERFGVSHQRVSSLLRRPNR